MDTNIKDFSIKVSPSKIAIDEGLELDDDVIVVIKGSIVKLEDGSNQDGTVSRTYIVKGILADVVKNEVSLVKTEVDTILDNITYG